MPARGDRPHPHARVLPALRDGSACVIDQRIAGVDIVHGDAFNVLGGQQRQGLCDQRAPIAAGQQFAFGRRIGVAQCQPQQGRSSCESGRGYVPDRSTGFCVAITKNGVGDAWVAPSRVTWCSAIASSRALWVRGGGTIDFIRQQHVGEHRPRMESEGARLRVVHRHAQHVGGQQVRGEPARAGSPGRG